MSDLKTTKQSSTVGHYQVVAGQPVRLDVVVGEGQPGGIAVAVEGKPLAHAPRIEALTLGKGEDLRGKRLIVTAIAIDKNPNSDLCSTTLKLSGGTMPRELFARVSADADQSVVFTFLVSFL